MRENNKIYVLKQYRHVGSSVDLGGSCRERLINKH